MNKRNRQHPSNPGKDNHENGHQRTTVSRIFRDLQGDRDHGARSRSPSKPMLDQLGPEGQMPGGKPFPMKIEPWPGGRWYRDLGNNSGHLWGHVQVIKPPTLLEICGPLMMSYPARQSPAIPLEGGGGRDAPCVRPPRHGIDPARTSRRLAQRLAVLAGAHSRAGGTQESEGDTTMRACCGTPVRSA